ncbi:MAG TPA: hypothetical protein PLR06_04365, partial [Cyclobacteriaceae bacterium]|nr:hypothetical protein [Cyclobacteriaceae bacterium]
EVDDMVTNQLNITDASGRTEGGSFEDDRCKCAGIVITRTPGANNLSGTVVIDFGTTGCTDSKGNVRKGKITINWTGGRWFNAGASHTITFTGYSINGVKFSDNDIRTVTNVSTIASPLTFNIVATHNLTWPDNSTSSRTIHLTRQWVRAANVTDDKVIFSQTAGADNAAAGTNRHGKVYTIKITTPLEYSRSCAISNKVFKPVKGVLVITYDTNKIVTIDFGSGTCDNTFTITAGGATRTVVSKNDGSDD